MDRKRLFDEHRRLAGKIFEDGLTPEEADQLSKVRDEIDQILVEEQIESGGLLGEELRKETRTKL
jgi:hypothetical protein